MNTTKALGLVILLVATVGCGSKAAVPVGMTVAEMQSKVIEVRKQASSVLREANNEVSTVKARIQNKEKLIEGLQDRRLADGVSEGELSLIESQISEAEADVAELEADLEKLENQIIDFKYKAQQAEDDIIRAQKLSTQVRK